MWLTFYFRKTVITSHLITRFYNFVHNILGVVMAFAVITPMILLAYALEGRKSVQATSMDMIFCFVAATLLIAAGG